MGNKKNHFRRRRNKMQHKYTREGRGRGGGLNVEFQYVKKRFDHFVNNILKVRKIIFKGVNNFLKT
jgi:hypothetical protein